MVEPSSAASLASAAGLSVPLASSLAEALVAGGLAERTGAGFVAARGLAALAGGRSEEILRADFRSGLLQMPATARASPR
jgi:hypothetical protein